MGHVLILQGAGAGGLLRLSSRRLGLFWMAFVIHVGVACCGSWAHGGVPSSTESTPEAELWAMVDRYADQIRKDAARLSMCFATQSTMDKRSSTERSPCLRGRANPFLQKEGQRLAERINRYVHALWEMTGYCLFTDISPGGLAWEGTKIADRYTEFSRKHRHVSLQQLRIDGLGSTIETLNSQYCSPALGVITRMVFFINTPGPPSIHEWSPISRKSAASIHATMKEWYEENKASLVLSKDTSFLVPKGPQWRFELPESVFQAWVGVDRGDVSTQPSQKGDEKERMDQ